MIARASTRWKVAGLAVAGLVIAGMSLPARADFLSDYTGHAVFGLGDPRGDGHVSFAVYENLGGGNWISALGLDTAGTVQQLKTGYPVIDNAPYVYFYQIVNTDPLPDSGSDRPLTGMIVRGAGSATSMGYLNGVVFNDVGIQDGNVVDGGGVGGTNVNLGVNTSNPDKLDDGAPSAGGFEFGRSPVFLPFLADSAAQRPDSCQFSFADLRFHFRNLTAHGFGDFSIDPGGYSSVLFFTSDIAPIYRFSILEDSADTQADLPSPAPEPLPIATLVVVGLPLTLLWTRRLRHGG